MLSNKKVGVAFGGGAALGFAHIGVLKALNEAHIKIEYLTGTSACLLYTSPSPRDA